MPVSTWTYFCRTEGQKKGISLCLTQTHTTHGLYAAIKLELSSLHKLSLGIPIPTTNRLYSMKEQLKF